MVALELLKKWSLWCVDLVSKDQKMQSQKGLAVKIWLWWWWRKEDRKEEEEDESFLEERVFRRECEFVKMKWMCAYVCVWL